jgi:methionine aminopeptidase
VLLWVQVICHGIPDQRELQDGDIVNVDVSAFLNGWHGDLNETFTVGTVSGSRRPRPPPHHPPAGLAGTACLQASRSGTDFIQGSPCRGRA